MRQKSLQSYRHNLPGVEPGPVPGAHLPGAKPLAESFAMSRFAGDSAPGKRPFAKAFCILPGLLPLANYQISCSEIKWINLTKKKGWINCKYNRLNEGPLKKVD